MFFRKWVFTGKIFSKSISKWFLASTDSGNFHGEIVNTFLFKERMSAPKHMSSQRTCLLKEHEKIQANICLLNTCLLKEHEKFKQTHVS